MKKFLAVVEFVIGGILCFVVVGDIPMVIRAFASGNVAYALGAVLGAFLLGYFDVWLIRQGRKTWDSSFG